MPGPDGLYVAGEGKISVYRCAQNGVTIRHLNLTTSSLKFSEFNGCVDVRGHIIASDAVNGVYVPVECVFVMLVEKHSVQPVGVTMVLCTCVALMVVNSKCMFYCHAYANNNDVLYNTALPVSCIHC